MPSFARFGNDLYSGRRSIDFVGRRKLWYTIAASAVVISLLALFVRGLNPGIEFRGGTQFQVTKTTVVDEQVGVNAVHAVVPGVQVQPTKLGTDGMQIEADKVTENQIDAIETKLAQAYQVPKANVSHNFIGPSWGADVTRQAIIGLVVFLLLVSLVIALYFRTWKMAMAALVALLHDLVLTMGIYALIGFEVTPASVIGFLTILGYSLYDTVVVFDKVRENTEHITATTKRTFSEAANLAVNQTLVRSINTSVVALLPVASILFIGAFLLGAGTLKDISLSLFVGIAAGTYSSIFIATPMLAHLRELEPEMRTQAQRVARRRSDEAAGGATSGGADGELAAVGSGTGVAAEPLAAVQPSGGQRQQPRRAAQRSGRPGAGGKKR